MTDKERHAYDEHLNAVMIQNDVLNTAKMEGRMEGLVEGRAEGRMEGLVEGRSEGLEIGREEGEKKERLKNARNFKEMGVPLDIIARATGLTIEEIESL